MIGGLLKSTSRFAIIAAAGVFVGGLALTPVKAADLGGDCCADLEERVADLEATTVRKGNKKVSLTVSGQINRAIGYLNDDLGEGEFYSSGNSVAWSNIQFDGSAKLTSTWTAGYQIRMNLFGDGSANLAYAGDANDSQSKYGTGTVAPEVDRNFVYLSNSTFGTVAFGQAGAPTDGVANISLAGNDAVVDSAGDSWNAMAFGFDLENDATYQAVAYISPTLAGFTLAVAWADVDGRGTAGLTGGNYETDVIDAALRYAGEFGPIRVAAGIGYTTYDDGTDGANLMGSAAVMHTPTGLNVAFAGGKEYDGGLLGAGTGDAEFWHVQGGVNKNFFGMGETSIYGEYGSYDFAAGATDDTTTMWGVGIVQHYDSAATELYLAYRQWDNGLFTDISGLPVASTEDTVSQVMAGMRIKF